MSSSIYLRNLSDLQSANSKIQIMFWIFQNIIFYEIFSLRLFSIKQIKTILLKKKKKVNCFRWNYGMNVGLKALSSNFYFSHDLHNEAISWQLLSCFIFQFSLVTQSCLTVCNLMDWRRPGLPVHHQHLESTHTHVDWVSDAIQPSHSLSPFFLPTVNLSEHQGLFKCVSSLHQVVKVLQFHLQNQSSQDWSPLAWTA